MNRRTPKDRLAREFSARQQRNPSYSLRAFARALQMPSGRLSEVLSGKRLLTARAGAQIARQLGFSPDERADFLKSVQEQKKPPRMASDPEPEPYTEMSADAFRAIADWHHFAILSLIETRGFRNDGSWIASRLGISPREAALAIERLKRLGLVSEKGRALQLTSQHLTTTHDIESEALRHSHRQSLEQAIGALDEVAIDLKDVTSVTMAIDPKRIAEAKGLIRAFRRKLCAFLEEGPRSEVYNLNIQLVPVTRRIARHPRGRARKAKK